MTTNYSIDLFKKEYSKELVNLWNNEVGFIFSLDDEIFKQKVLDSKHIFLEGSYVAKVDDKIVGFIISKVYNNDPIIAKYFNRGWISLIFVKREYRKLGIGNSLLDISEKKMQEFGVNSISVGADMDNFFPGIPNDFDNLTDVFFKNRGYSIPGVTHDLYKVLTKQDNVESFKDISIEGKKVLIRYAAKNDEKGVLEFLKCCFPGRWYQEGFEYFSENDIKKEYLIALFNNEVIGFLRVNNQLIKRISYNITWKNNFKKLVGIGPLGVNKLYRKHGIAEELILFALSDAYNNGYKEALIDWTGLISYYQKFGFQVWKCFSYANKTL